MCLCVSYLNATLEHNTTLINSYKILCTFKIEDFLFSLRKTLCSWVVRVRLPIIHVHLQMKICCGPRTCCKRKNCMPKHSILFIYVPYAWNHQRCERMKIWRWRKKNINEICTALSHDCMWRLRIRYTHWHQLVHLENIFAYIVVGDHHFEWALNQNGRYIYLDIVNISQL